MIRQHQFDKLEMETFCLPEDGQEEQHLLVAVQEYLMQQLEIPYHTIICCTGDMGDCDYRHVDVEAWIPSQDKYRETHSSDYMTDYQSRRMNIRYKTAEGQK
ncbi:MAG: aminoacyl--tRNA ligase-related protein [bacterium]